MLGKQNRTSFLCASSYRATRGLELVHTNLCGPITPETARGKRYFLLIVDDYSRFMWIELLRTKDEAYERFVKVKAEEEASCARSNRTTVASLTRARSGAFRQEWHYALYDGPLFSAAK